MSCHVFAGPDRGRVKEAVDQVLQGLTKRLGEKPETESFYAGEDSMDQVVSKLRNTGLFSAHLFAVINCCESLNAADQKILKAYAAHPNESATLVFVSDDPKAATDKLSFIPKDKIKIMYEMNETEKKAFIHHFLERQKAAIEQDALEFFCDLVSSDTDDIKAQCGLLINTTKPGTAITLDTVEEFIYHSREETVYTLFDVLLEGDLAGALECVHKIILSQESEPIGIVLGLQWQYRGLQDLKDAGIRRPSFDDFRARRIFMKRTQQVYQSALDKYSLKDIMGFTDTIARYDQLIREARTGSHLLHLEMMVYELTQRRQLDLGNPSIHLFGT